jgi:hypothetical protein
MAGFNIAKFSSKINERGTIQNNKFLIKISKPIGSTDDFFLNPYKEEDLIFRAASIEIPGVSFESTNSHRYGVGPQQKTPRNPNFNDVSISFIEDERNGIWKFFSSWINQIFNFDSDRMYVARYKSEYISPNFEIEVSNNKGIPVTSIILTEAFPSSLGNVGLSWNDKNNLMMVKVGFSFTDWYWGVPGLTNFRETPINNNTGANQTTNQVVPAPNPGSPNPYSPENNTNVSPDGMLFGPGGLSG